MVARQRHHPTTALTGVDDGAPRHPRGRRDHRRARRAGGALPGAAGVGHKRRSPCVESSHLTRTPVTATKGTPTMATDYDAPRRTESDDATKHSLDELTKRRNDAAASVIDVDETDTAEGFELPGADLSGEELSVRVVPKQADEFTCSTCFLVHHRHRYAGRTRRPADLPRLRGITALRPHWPRAWRVFTIGSRGTCRRR